jgi:hypothetical protein
VEREYGGKGALTPSLFPDVVVGAAGAATVLLHDPFSVPDSFPGAFGDSHSNRSINRSLYNWLVLGLLLLLLYTYELSRKSLTPAYRKLLNLRVKILVDKDKAVICS